MSGFRRAPLPRPLVFALLCLAGALVAARAQGQAGRYRALLPLVAANDTVGAGGATLATTTGSTIVVPSGAAAGTTVAVQDKSQQQVTTEQGIEWDKLGVTFLGAIDVQSSTPITTPLGVSSVGFGNRVQPGQAVVTYQLLPDQDGDGAAELVVVNGASVAPNGTIVSSPVPQLVVNSIQVAAQAQLVAATPQANELRGSPGGLITIRGSGFTGAATTGNEAVFRSGVNGETLTYPAIVTPDPVDSTAQIVSLVIPPLAAGPASIVLRNNSTSATAGPFSLTIAAAAAFRGSSSQIIDTYLAQAGAQLSSLPNLDPQFASLRDQTAEKIAKAKALFPKLYAETNPAVQQLLADIATVMQSGAPQTQRERQVITPQVDARTVLIGIGIVIAVTGARCAVIVAPEVVPLLGLAKGTVDSIATIGAFLRFAGALIGAGAWFSQQAGCSASPAAGGGGRPKLLRSADAAPQQSGSGSTVGMGSASPPGGNGCGGILDDLFGDSGPARASGIAAASAGSRYTVKVLPKGGAGNGLPLSPFTGANDPGGYFFLPLIPMGQPFTAVAVDSFTGAVQTFDGVGPAIGQSVYMYFDFSGTKGNRFPIAIGDTVADGVPATGAGNIETPSGIDIYPFNAIAGQRVYFQETSGDCLSPFTWRLVDGGGTEVFKQTLGGTGCGQDAGAFTLTRGGTYNLIVTSNQTGAYSFKLWDVPPPQQFALALGATVANGTPGPGAGNIETPGVQDSYTFSAAAGQRVYFAELTGDCLSPLGWRLKDQSGAEIFNQTFGGTGCGQDAGAFTLAGGTYTLSVFGRTDGLGESSGRGTGTYSFQIRAQ